MKTQYFYTHYLYYLTRTTSTMIKSFFDSLEDPKRPFFGPNFWLLTKSGLLLPVSFLKRTLSITILVLLLFFVLSQYAELYVIRSDLDLVLTNLKISMQSTMCVIKAGAFVIWQDKWRKVIDYITESDIFERENQDDAKGKIIQSYTKYSRRVTYFYLGLVGATIVTVTSSPIIIWFSSHTFREGFYNGTEYFPHIFSSWMPFDKDSSPGCWITVLCHMCVTVYGSMVAVAYDTTITVVLVYFGGKLDLLRVRCREMLGVVGKVTDKAAEDMVRQLHGIHILLLKHSRLFNSVLSPVMFCYVVVCSLMICASAYQLTSATNTTQKLLKAEYLIFGIAQLFMFCWHSNDVITKSHDVMMGVYESKWWAAGLEQRKYVLLLQGQLRVGHIYSAGPFTNLTLSAFFAILKGAYSYYTLLSKTSRNI